MQEETRQRLSESRKGVPLSEEHKQSCRDAWLAREHKPNGFGKGGYHNGIWLRSSWELLAAEKLDEAGVRWEYEKRRFKIADGRIYIPDFWLPVQEILIEVKGWWTPAAKEKFELFLSQFKSERIFVLDCLQEISSGEFIKRILDDV